MKQVLNVGGRLLLMVIFLSIAAAPASQAQVDTLCPNVMTLEIEGHLLKLLYCSNYPLDQSIPDVTRAIIVIHGISRTAPTEYERVLEAATDHNQAATTFILAPQFLIDDDLEAHHLGEDFLYWNRWSQGDLSLSRDAHPRPVRFSSFEVVTRIQQHLVDTFPNLANIIIAGHSAGGQFANRYAAANPLDEALAAEGIHTRYIVANPSSYLYFNDDRRVYPTTDQFATPSEEIQAICPKYNEYKYGPEDLNRHMTSIGLDALITHYATREVVYLLGEEDVTDEHNLATNCRAMLQGLNRLERGLIYYNYIGHFFGPPIYEKHQLIVVPEVAHSSRGIYQSAAGVRYLFDVND